MSSQPFEIDSIGLAWRQQYFDALNHPLFSEVDMERAFKLKAARLPNYLYRYRSFDREGLTLSSLRSGKTWLANPNSFNDPYDSSLSIEVRAVQTHWIRTKLKTAADQGGKLRFTEEELKDILSAEDRAGRIAEMIWRKQGETVSFAKKQAYGALFDVMIERANSDFEKRMKDSIRVCCFCEDPTSILMWSHYADRHSGFCLQYETSELLATRQLKHIIHPVCYSESRFDASRFITFEQGPNPWIAVLAALNKSIDWSYEREWRLIFLPGDAPQDSLYDFVKPRRIIMGARAGPGLAAPIQAISGLAEVPISFARLSPSKFSVEFDE